MSAPLPLTQPDPSAIQLRVIPLRSGQFAIENGPGHLGSEFDRYYVHLSGYCGSHNPWVFAAAPELLAALWEAIDELHKVALSPRDVEAKARHESVMARSLAAIAKATGAS